MKVAHTHWGPYQFISSIGAGGMGEVFRARDRRLNRDVAVKVLPKDFTADADRLRRFEQEAKTLAALNHPNVLTVFDAGVHEGAPYLVSELLEGRTLREELNGGAIPLRKAADYALQMASGLAAAHAKGVVHRDLKPENIFVTSDGRVKILDFGLAKLRLAANSTIRVEANTEPGLVMGTPAYMSPEQVRGEPADHRADIFAFGAVFYEMLGGTRAFRRNTPVASMNAVLSEEPPDLATVKPDLPVALIRVVHRCVEKSPERRFQTADDLAFAIANAGASASGVLQSMPSRRPSFTAALGWAVAALCLAALAVVFSRSRNPTGFRAPQAVSATLRSFDLTLPIPPRNATNDDFLYPVISPDGKKIAFANADGLWLRRMDRAGPPVRLSAGEEIVDPFWSPDSTEIGYFQGRRVLRMPITGGNPTLVAIAPQNGIGGVTGGAWVKDRIIFGTGGSELLEAPAHGGKVTTALALSDGDVDYHSGSALPDGRGILFVIHRLEGVDTIAVFRPGEGRQVLLQLPGSMVFRPVFSPTGHVLFHRDDTLHGIWAFPFSLEKLKRTGEVFRVSETGTEPSVANDGTLLFSLRGWQAFAQRQLTWVDRSGKILGTIGPALPGLWDLSLSPDQRRVAASAGESLADSDIWLFDVTGSGALPLTRNAQSERNPRWLDNRTILFTREDGSNIWMMAKSPDDPEGERRYFNGRADLSSSKKYLVTQPSAASRARGHVSVADERQKLIEWPESLHRARSAQISPDDRRLAFCSDEGTGVFEVYLVDFPGFTNKSAVSRGGGGFHPLWNAAGTELFYFSNNGRRLMCAKLRPDGHGTEEPTRLFDLPETIAGGRPWLPRFYDVANDGTRFLMLTAIQEKPTPERAALPNARFVLNWIEEFPDNK